MALALVLPAWAHAQVLDFDGVCASPPCAAGSLYSAYGISITVGNVVAAGTNGLTGTNGGEYLSVVTSQTSFLFTRPATSFSAVLSRASTASGTVTVAVIARKLGVTVGGPVFVPLSAVNTWTPVSIAAAGGFDQILLNPSGGPT